MISTETCDHVRRLLLRQLETVGISQLINQKHSQFLDLDNCLFAEIVLNDAIRLEEVEELVRRLAAELASSGIVLDRVVRALWEIVDVRYWGPSRSPDGGIRAASEYHVTLKSGEREHLVILDVSSGAVEVLKQKLGSQHLRFEKHVSQAVRWFVQDQLSLGGTGYWSPLVAPRLEINTTAMSFLIGHRSSIIEASSSKIEV